MKIVFQYKQQFSQVNEENNELKRSFDETILVTQAAGGEKTMQAAKATKTKGQIDKERKVLRVRTMGSFGKALRIGALVAKFALKLLKKSASKARPEPSCTKRQEQLFDEELKAVRKDETLAGHQTSFS